MLSVHSWPLCVSRGEDMCEVVVEKERKGERHIKLRQSGKGKHISQAFELIFISHGTGL